MRITAITCTVVALFATQMPSAGAEILDLQNDGFTSGQAAGFQAGFVTGEIGAVRLDVPGAEPAQLNQITLLFGGAATSQNITLRIWDDTGADAPGPLLHEADYMLTGSNEAFSSIDLAGDNVLVGGSFRVGIVFQHSGVPSIARDNDGTIKGTHNFIFAQGLGWVRSNLLGLTGDWVIRATVDTGSGMKPDAGVTPDASQPTGPDASVTPDASTGGQPDASVDVDASTGGQMCMVHSECPTGQYCDEDDTCTYDCRVDWDCPSGQRCTSLGMCEDEPDPGCGCRVGEARSGGANSGIGWLFGLGLGMAVWWRRRRRSA